MRLHRDTHRGTRRLTATYGGGTCRDINPCPRGGRIRERGGEGAQGTGGTGPHLSAGLPGLCCAADTARGEWQLCVVTRLV